MKSKVRDPIPEEFATLDEAAEFWDTHDLADYWDLTEEVDFEVNLHRRRYLVAVEPELVECGLRPPDGDVVQQLVAAQGRELLTALAQVDPVIGLVHEWMADESGYDEQVWPTVKKSIEEYRLSDRRR